MIDRSFHIDERKQIHPVWFALAEMFGSEGDLMSDFLMRLLLESGYVDDDGDLLPRGIALRLRNFGE